MPDAPASRMPTDRPRVVIGYDFIDLYGGAERIAATIAEAFPDAPFWSLVGRPDVAARMGIEDRFFTILPQAKPVLDHFRALTPLYPAIVSARRLPPADVLLTASFGFAHGLRTVNDAPQVCYCFSPLRFAWSMTDDYGERYGDGVFARRAFGALAAGMRSSDRLLSRRVTRYVAESNYVAEQIRRFYGREAEVIWPPVDCDLFRPAEVRSSGDYYLFCGRLVEPYKRPTMTVEAFRSLPRERLLIAGDGPMLAHLKEIAPDNVEFAGKLGDDDLVAAMQGCKAAIFPSRDDFGLVPVEVMACGRPVLAYGAGGALETVAPGRTGEFFEKQDVDTLVAAIESFDPSAYDPLEIRSHAERWSANRFREAIRGVVGEVARAGA